MVDEVGRPVEASAERLERWAERLSEEAGQDVAVDHFPPQVPASARATRVGTWPNGEPMVVVTYWSTPTDQD
jgi:hypothetical protein